jgi:hypothetical protein
MQVVLLILFAPIWIPLVIFLAPFWLLLVAILANSQPGK